MSLIKRAREVIYIYFPQENSVLQRKGLTNRVVEFTFIF